jgi:hypothetical protein
VSDGRTRIDAGGKLTLTLSKRISDNVNTDTYVERFGGRSRRYPRRVSGRDGPMASLLAGRPSRRGRPSGRAVPTPIDPSRRTRRVVTPRSGADADLRTAERPPDPTLARRELGPTLVGGGRSDDRPAPPGRWIRHRRWYNTEIILEQSSDSVGPVPAPPRRVPIAPGGLRQCPAMLGASRPARSAPTRSGP